MTESEKPGFVVTESEKPGFVVTESEKPGFVDGQVTDYHDSPGR
ncbi:hypothetical protein [Streptomyces collinus]